MDLRTVVSAAVRHGGMLVGAGRAAIALLVGCVADPALSQVLPPGAERAAERVQEREQERRRDREEGLRERLVTPPSGARAASNDAGPGEGGQCVPVRTVEIAGMTRYGRDLFAADLAPLTGPCVSTAHIDGALRAITNRYVKDGYVTSRAVVGPQSLADGVLELIVVEGEVSAVRSASGGFGKGALLAAFPGLERRHLNLRDIEQGVDQLSRLPSSEPDVDIEPGELPGMSAVSIRRKMVGRRYRPAFTIDNEGQEATGRAQSNMSLDGDNILGVADFWSVYYLRDLDRRSESGNGGVGGFFSVPYGYWTLTLVGGRYTYESVLDPDGLAFSNTGRSWNAGATLDRMLFRDARTKVSVSGSLGLLDTENRIQGIRLSTSSYRLVTGTIEARLQRTMLGGIVSAELGLVRGLDVLGANAADTGPDGPKVAFGKVEASAGYRTRQRVLGVPLDYSVTARGQAALDPVLPAERLSLGGSATIRGFRNDGISGRHGLFARQQIGFPLATLFGGGEGQGLSFSGFGGYDVGGILPRGENRFERGLLQSATVGLRAQHGRIQAEVGASAPLSAPAFVKHKDMEVSASLRLSI